MGWVKLTKIPSWIFEEKILALRTRSGKANMNRDVPVQSGTVFVIVSANLRTGNLSERIADAMLFNAHKIFRLFPDASLLNIEAVAN